MKHTNWFKDAIFYQIYPRSFKDGNNDGMGDIKGIISKLDHLKELGVNTVWLSPVYDSPQKDNGYDISNYYDIYPPFGTLDDFKEMIKQMHARGIRLVMDLVVNHTSSEHPWFKDALKDKNSPYRDYYFIKKGRKNGKLPPNNWSGFFGGSTWERIEGTDEYYLHLFAKEQPDLNWLNPQVKEEVKNILRYWLDMGVDGFRCDVITLISKDDKWENDRFRVALMGKHHYINGPHLHEYLKELYNDVFDHYDCMTVGETVMSNLEDAKMLAGPNRRELSMVFNFDHTDIDNYLGVKFLERKFNLKRFKKIYKKWQLGLEGEGWNSLFIENHDQRRCVGRFNTNDKSLRVVSSKMLASFYFLMKGTPFIYQGQEIAMTNTDYKSIDDFKDVETHNMFNMMKNIPPVRLLLTKGKIFRNSRDNARTPMQWDNSTYAGFSDSEPWMKVNENKYYINVEAAKEDKTSTYYHYQKLIEIRKKYKLIKDGRYEEVHPKDKDLFIYKRVLDDEEIVVISNFKNKTISRKYLFDYDRHELLLSNYDVSGDDYLKPYESRVYYKKGK